MTEVKQKYALVTGASRGIGRAVSVQLAEMGYYVLINFQSNEEAAKETLALVREKGSDGELMKFDVANQEDVNQVLEKWIEENKDKRIEVLINNAGIRKDQLMMFMSREEWDSVINIGMGGFYNVTRLVLKGMHLNRYGRIVNVVSLSGIKGMPGQTNYSAAKGGMIAAAKALSQEVGRRGITVNSVAPGFIKTDMTEDIDEKDFKKLIPLNRFGTAEEVADAVCFLASPKASYITGQVLSINGGLYS
ncbi:3-oxoacyl-ACP reductase FabG [Arcticibacterium luteifluviistationis]|uniref:3-oxoacyl-ACP reductase FabG n=1 Tax=Arcticibacterium luteifluviistationis TaxID=1784714 RepID=A0A2Z4GDS7_9BACT|nr:3-oxoacyl-ACP reductase FabG [Arcticibacterium luteifluviistationis]AWV99175.1 3-oxoacyl-ACP reductase FabG [Arcticibacterium luteifluviistationis]